MKVIKIVLHDGQELFCKHIIDAETARKNLARKNFMIGHEDYYKQDYMFVIDMTEEDYKKIPATNF